MPQGLAAIGVVVAGAFGASSVALTTVSFATIAIGAVTSAVVGAAIGGIAAAVTGGDIGKGMLFGAIGGVVTGGLAGGMLAEGLGTSVLSGQGMASQGVGSAGFMTQHVPAAMGTVAEAGGSAGIFGGALNLGGAGILPSVLDFAAGGLEEAPAVDWRTTEEGVRFAAEENAANIKAQIDGQKFAPTPWQNTEEGNKYNRGMDYQMNSDNNANRLKEVEKNYELQKEQTTHEYSLGRKTHEEAAQAAASGTYAGATEEQKKAIIAKQSGATPVPAAQPTALAGAGGE